VRVDQNTCLGDLQFNEEPLSMIGTCVVQR
jgi:hypothetical protein